MEFVKAWVIAKKVFGKWRRNPSAGVAVTVAKQSCYVANESRGTGATS